MGEKALSPAELRIQNELKRKKSAPRGEIVELKKEDLIESPFNAGLEDGDIEMLAKSLEANGLFDPIVVYDLKNGKYEIFSGHRRKKAWCDILGNDTIKAIVKAYPSDPKTRLKQHTEANSTARDHDVRFWTTRIELAAKQISEQQEVSDPGELRQKIQEIIGISRSNYFRYLRILKLIPELREDAETKKVAAKAFTESKILASLGDDQQRKVHEVILAEKLKYETDHADDVIPGEFQLTAAEFEEICETVRKGSFSSESKTAVRKNAVKEMEEVFRTAEKKLMKKTKSIRTEEEKAEFSRCIEEQIGRLEEIKSSLKVQ